MICISPPRPALNSLSVVLPGGFLSFLSDLGRCTQSAIMRGIGAVLTLLAVGAAKGVCATNTTSGSMCEYKCWTWDD